MTSENTAVGLAPRNIIPGWRTYQYPRVNGIEPTSSASLPFGMERTQIQYRPSFSFLAAFYFNTMSRMHHGQCISYCMTKYRVHLGRVLNFLPRVTSTSLTFSTVVLQIPRAQYATPRRGRRRTVQQARPLHLPVKDRKSTHRPTT